MSYVDQRMSTGRVWAIVLVAILHALLGYAFVTGLAYKFVKGVQEDLKTFDVTEEPPPPEELPPPPETPDVQPPPVVAPPPIVRTQTPPPPIASVPTAPPVVITPTAPPAPPAPPGPAAAAASHRRAGPRPRQPRLLRLQRRLSGLGSAQRGRGHDWLPSHRRPEWPRIRLHGYVVERLERARCRHLPDHAQPRPFHAGSRQSGQPDHGLGERPHHVANPGIIQFSLFPHPNLPICMRRN